jgi:hypothetical protein
MYLGGFLLTSSLLTLDVIFLGVTAVASTFCLFFNKYLPAIDVSTHVLMPIN